MAILGPQDGTVESGSMREPQAREEIRLGLLARPRRISSRFFYDAQGSAIFSAITRLPEYYLTACEMEILESRAEAIASAVGGGMASPVALIEAGPGDARKASFIARAFLRAGVEPHYEAVDISQSAVSEAVSSIERNLQIKASGVTGDYHELLPQIGDRWRGRKKLLLFLGSSIGNYSAVTAVRLLRTLRASLEEGDYALIGFDLKKDEAVLVPAYSDHQGLTREFNLNLLRRINDELGGSFNLQAFEHRAVYNADKGAMQSFLVSVVDQEVRIEGLDLDILLLRGEAIHTEDSHKYSTEDIASLARAAGFNPVHNFMDTSSYFSCSLWQALPFNNCSAGSVHQSDR